MNLEDMRKNAVYLFDGSISPFEKPLLEGFLRAPNYFDKPQFTVPIRFLGREEVSWRNEDYSIYANASRYLANVRSIPEDSVEPRFEEKILFDGAIILVSPLELVSPKGFKIGEPHLGRIWTSRSVEREFGEEGALRRIILGNATSEEEIVARAVNLSHGYRVQEIDQKERRSKIDLANYVRATRGSQH